MQCPHLGALKVINPHLHLPMHVCKKVKDGMVWHVLGTREFNKTTWIQNINKIIHFYESKMIHGHYAFI
jgi:hypothetical protein